MVLSMDRWIGKVAIVTGTSSGIGKSIAEQLVELGLKVVGLARRRERLEQLKERLTGKKGQFYPVVADLSKEEDILNAFKWVKQNVGPISILVNNGGANEPTTLHEGSTGLWKKILDTNILGLCIATREAISSMKENNIDGHIIHINSVQGHIVAPVPNRSVYPASKFAVTALTQTLRFELNDIKSKIKVTSVSPAATYTEFSNSYAILNKIPGLDPEDIADGVVYVLSTPPHVQVHELTINPIGAGR